MLLSLTNGSKNIPTTFSKCKTRPQTSTHVAETFHLTLAAAEAAAAADRPVLVRFQLTGSPRGQGRAQNNPDTIRLSVGTRAVRLYVWLYVSLTWLHQSTDRQLADRGRQTPPGHTAEPFDVTRRHRHRRRHRRRCCAPQLCCFRTAGSGQVARRWLKNIPELNAAEDENDGVNNGIFPLVDRRENLFLQQDQTVNGGIFQLSVANGSNLHPVISQINAIT